MNTNVWVTDIPHLQPIAPNRMMLQSCVIWLDDKGKSWRVPAGFITDGASLPWIVTAIWDRWEPKTLQASILHDYGYTTQMLGTKEEVDERFYRGLLASKWKHAKTYYRAVKHMGWYAWNLQRNIDQQYFG
jgi:hypothetical protein